MKYDFDGHALFLDRSDINTDEIIPAKYLTEIDRHALKSHLLEDLNLNGFDSERDIVNAPQPYSTIITRDNFGCGSSREHAPWALAENGIHMVVAGGFARIFRQNMFNCGMLAVTLPPEPIEELFRLGKDGKVSVQVDLETHELLFDGNGRNLKYDFSLDEFDEKLVCSGGWVNFAAENY